MAQMARFRQPGAAAIAFMNTLAATDARFSARARSARRPRSARAMPRQAKTSAAALRSHRPERSPDHRGGADLPPGPGAGVAGPAMITRRPDAGGWPVMVRPVPAPGKVTAGIATVMSD